MNQVFKIKIKIKIISKITIKLKDQIKIDFWIKIINHSFLNRKRKTNPLLKNSKWILTKSNK